MLEIRDLHVRFHDSDHEAVRGIGLSVADGEIVGLVGESGSGKTVTAMTVSGLLDHRKGRPSAARSVWTDGSCLTSAARSCGLFREKTSASCFRSR